MPSTTSATKDCPQCRALLAGDAQSCVCGYRFETPESNRPTNLLAQAEELYETHLRARLQRAVRAVKLAKVDLLRDPGNPEMKRQLREAEKEASILETQIAAQVARVADVRAVAEIIGPAPAAPEAAEAFRAAQATKAERSLDLVNLELAAERVRASEATAVFKAVQAEKARAVEQRTTSVAIHTCPGCGVPVTPGVARCDCGYRLQGADNSGEFLSADEFAALRGS